jgi:hemoglobin
MQQVAVSQSTSILEDVMKIFPLKIRAVMFCLALLLAHAVQSAAGETSPTSQPSLYDRLGGLMPISVVVDDFIDALVLDPILNANPAIDTARKRVPSPYLKYHVTAMVCQAAGGPCQYHGRGMKESHVHLNITESEWARMVTVFKEVLARHQVPQGETQELLAIVDSTKGDIVIKGK